MIRRLIILLLIVGCKDEEEPMGLCYFLTQLDNMTLESISNGEDPFHLECKNSYTKSECCEDIRAEGICPEAYNLICYGNEIGSFEFPLSLIWKENTTCEEFEYDFSLEASNSTYIPYYGSICNDMP